MCLPRGTTPTTTPSASSAAGVIHHEMPLKTTHEVKDDYNNIDISWSGHLSR